MIRAKWPYTALCLGAKVGENSPMRLEEVVMAFAALLVSGSLGSVLGWRAS